MKTYTIRTINGKVKYVGTASNRREFVKQLLADGTKDFKGVNLSSGRGKYDLTHLDFSDCDFRGAKLTNVDFSGSNISGANFSNTEQFHNTFSSCKSYRLINVSNASLDSVNWSHAQIRNANFSGSSLRRNHFYDSSLVGADFSNTIQSKTRFINATAYKTNWENSYVEENEFVGVDFVGDEPEKGMTIFSDGAFFINTVKKDGEFINDKTGATEFQPNLINKKDLRELKSDWAVAKTTSVLWGTTYNALLASAFLGAAHFGAGELLNFDQKLSTLASQAGVYGIGIIALKSLVLDNVAKMTEDKVQFVSGKLGKAARKFVQNCGIHVERFGSYGGLIVKNATFSHIMNVINIEKENSSNQFLRNLVSAPMHVFNLSNKEKVIFADRKTIALALEKISKARHYNYTGKHDLTILRKDNENENDVPSMIKFCKDGTTKMGWTKNGKLNFIVHYNKNGLTESVVNLEKGKVKALNTTRSQETFFEQLVKFEDKLLKEHDIDLKYPRDTHIIERRPDLGFEVKNKNVKKVSNPEDGYAAQFIHNENTNTWDKKHYSNGQSIEAEIDERHEQLLKLSF